MSHKPVEKVLWIKALVNGIFVWILGFILYLIPALVVAFKMSFKLGPKSDNPAEISEQISRTIATIYQNNILLTIGFILVTALLIIWRARSVSKISDVKGLSPGLLVAVFPVIFSILFDYSTGFDISSIIEILAFIGAGYMGAHLYIAP